MRAIAALTAALAEGSLTPGETSEFDKRLSALEASQAMGL